MLLGFFFQLVLMPVFGGYENETEEDRQEALSSQGRKKQQPQVSQAELRQMDS